MNAWAMQHGSHTTHGMSRDVHALLDYLDVVYNTWQEKGLGSIYH